MSIRYGMIKGLRFLSVHFQIVIINNQYNEERVTNKEIVEKLN
jgi:hypothetical protein